MAVFKKKILFIRIEFDPFKINIFYEVFNIRIYQFYTLIFRKIGLLNSPFDIEK